VGGALQTIGRLTSSNENTYLPEFKLDFDAAQFVALRGPGQPANVRFVIHREGGLCNGAFANLTAHATLADVTLDFGGVQITSTTLPAAMVGSSYSAALTAQGGQQPFTWAATGLPAGLSLNATTGVISGRPIAASTATVNVNVRTADGLVDNASLTLVLAPLPTSWVGTIEVSMISQLDRVEGFDDSATNASHHLTVSRTANVSGSASVDVAGLRLGAFTAMTVQGKSGNGALESVEDTIDTFVDEPDTFFACLVKTVAHTTSDVRLGLNPVASGVPALRLNADGSYSIDLGTMFSFVGDGTSHSVGTLSRTQLAQGFCRGSPAAGPFDNTSVISRQGAAIGPAEAGDIVQRIEDGTISGTARKTTPLSVVGPQSTQTGSQTVTVTWHLRPK
jgi:Putative Ig domain